MQKKKSMRIKQKTKRTRKNSITSQNHQTKQKQEDETHHCIIYV